MMAASRKLQGEIDRCLKKVTEGVETFEDIWQKVHNATNSNQKEKYEADLKKEIKKLQRLRDQIKSWIASAEIKDKTVLMDNRKLIETQMERFKVVERETKTKAYSKEGLGAAQKLDPAQKEREEIEHWLSNSIDALNIQTDSFESEIESMLANKKKKVDKDKQERIDELRGRLERHRFHIRKLETLLRMLYNMSVEVLQIRRIKDNVEYYIESSQEPDFEDNEYIYDDIIDFDDIDMSGVGLPSAATTDSNETGGGTPTSIISGSSPIPSPAAVGPPPPATFQHQPNTNHSSDTNSCSTNEGIDGKRSAAATLKDAPPPKPVKPTAIRATSTSLSSSTMPNSTTLSTSGTNSMLTFTGSTKTSASIITSTIGGNASVMLSKTATSSPPIAAVAAAAVATLTTTISSNFAAAVATQPSAAATAASNNSTNSNSTANLKPNQSNGEVQQLHAPPPTSVINTHNDNNSSSQVGQQQQQPQQYSVITSTTQQAQSGTLSLMVAASQSHSTMQTITTSNTSSSSTTVAPLAANTHIMPQQQQQQPKLYNHVAEFQCAVTNLSPRATPPSRLSPILNNYHHSESQQQQQHLINGPVSIMENHLPPHHHQQQPHSHSHPHHHNGNLEGNISLKTMAQQVIDRARLVDQTTATMTTKSSDVAFLLLENNSGGGQQVAPASGVVVSSSPSSTGIPTSPIISAATSVVASSTSAASLLKATVAPRETSEAQIPPLLGVAPLGTVPLQKEHQQQFQLMEAAFCHLPQANDSERVRAYLTRTPCPTPLYYSQAPLPHSDTVEFYQRLTNETLFFVFYYMEGTKAQYLAAKALKKQSWRFHTKYMMWFQRHEEPKIINEDYEQGTYIYFDYEKWGQRKKEGFTFEYKYLEDRDLN